MQDIGRSAVGKIIRNETLRASSECSDIDNISIARVLLANDVFGDVQDDIMTIVQLVSIA